MKLIISILLYGSECWTLTKSCERKLLVTEMSWLRRMIGVSRKERIRNEIIRQRTGQAENIILKIKRRRLTWFGHVERMNEKRLPNKAFYTYSLGPRTRGRQRKRWIDNIQEDVAEWGMSLGQAAQETRNRETWKSLIWPHRRSPVEQ